MRIFQLVIPAHAPDCAALARAMDGLKKARCSIAKAEGVGRRDLAVVGPRYMYRSGRMVGLVYRLYIERAGEIAVVAPGDAPAGFDPWAGEAKEI